MPGEIPTTKSCQPEADAAPGSWHALSGTRKPGVLVPWLWDGEGWHVHAGNPISSSPDKMSGLGWSYVQPLKEADDDE